MAKSRKRKSVTSSRQILLWQWGAFLIIAGPVGYMLMTAISPLEPPLTNEQRGQAFGRGLVAVVSVLAGLSMIVLHVVKRTRR